MKINTGRTGRCGPASSLRRTTATRPAWRPLLRSQPRGADVLNSTDPTICLPPSTCAGHLTVYYSASNHVAPISRLNRHRASENGKLPRYPHRPSATYRLGFCRCWRRQSASIFAGCRRTADTTCPPSHHPAQDQRSSAHVP